MPLTKRELKVFKPIYESKGLGLTATEIAEESGLTKKDVFDVMPAKKESTLLSLGIVFLNKRRNPGYKPLNIYCVNPELLEKDIFPGWDAVITFVDDFVLLRDDPFGRNRLRGVLEKGLKK